MHTTNLFYFMVILLQVVAAAAPNSINVVSKISRLEEMQKELDFILSLKIGDFFKLKKLVAEYGQICQSVFEHMDQTGIDSFRADQLKQFLSYAQPIHKKINKAQLGFLQFFYTQERQASEYTNLILRVDPVSLEVQAILNSKDVNVDQLREIRKTLFERQYRLETLYKILKKREEHMNSKEEQLFQLELSLKKKEAELAPDILQLQSENLRLQETVNSLMQETTNNSEIASLSCNVVDLHTEVINLKSENSRLANELNLNEGKRTLLAKRIDLLEDINTKLTQKSAECALEKQDLDIVQNESESRLQLINELNEKIDLLESQVKELEASQSKQSTDADKKHSGDKSFMSLVSLERTIAGVCVVLLVAVCLLAYMRERARAGNTSEASAEEGRSSGMSGQSTRPAEPEKTAEAAEGSSSQSDGR